VTTEVIPPTDVKPPSRIHPAAIIFGVFGLLVALQLVFLGIALSQPSELLPEATTQSAR
jgi:hypothetical protein